MSSTQIVAFLLAIAGSAFAESAEFENDPYMAYRPAFARSLPVQIMLTGVVLTLVAVLFIHLLFTGQYHWPLAPVNYVLQLSGVTTLLISLIATIHVVLSATFAESEKWPYMLSYIAVNVPPLDMESNTEMWSVAERATWLVMNASTSGLIQITHIQFLTLLYPSRLEGRLIFALLGPLAVVAAIMQLLPISKSLAVNGVASAVRNVCNATLSLLFTVALFLWGLLVNREQAWRTDGGTAVFGGAALLLAVVSTALNFLYVHKEEEFVWLPGLMWAVVLWQSFLGWWWWVGAGSGGGYTSEDDTMEEKLRREAKRESRRKEARERRKETKIKAARVWRGVAGAFSPSSASRTGHDEAAVGPSAISRDVEVDASEVSDSRRRRSRRDDNADSASVESRATSITVTSSYSELTRSSLPRLLPTVVHRWYASLRRAHNQAARLQAAERVERIRELGRGRTSAAEDVDAGPSERRRRCDDVRWGWGWGWGGLGWTTTRTGTRGRRTSRVSEKEASMSRSRTRTRSRSQTRRVEDETDADAGYEMDDRRPHRRRTKDDEGVDEDGDGDMYVSEPEDVQNSRGRTMRGHRRMPESEANTTRRNNAVDAPNPMTDTGDPETRSRSLWWWGPLRRWRLQDSTVY